MPCIEGLKYYYEPSVDVRGKYSRELAIDKVLELRQEAVEKYGERLSRMVIDYSKRKDGIKITVYLYNEERKRPYYLEPRDEMDVIHVFYGRTDKALGKQYWIYPDGKREEFEIGANGRCEYDKL